MSINTHLYFGDIEFPRAKWEEILTIFDAEPRELLELSVGEHQTYLAEWIVRYKGAVVWCSLSAFRGGTLSPQNVRWTITTDCTGAPTALLGVANLAYAVLSWVPNASFDDLNGRVCHTPEELVEIYIPHLAERFAAGNFNKMFEANILDYDGKLNF